MSALEYRILGITLCVLGAVLLSLSQWGLRLWKKQIKKKLYREIPYGGTEQNDL